MNSKKLYCYVDETGQDTEGDIFVVSVVIPKNRDELLTYVEDIETKSGKGKFKWGRARPDARYRYMEIILSQKKYPVKVCFSYYKDTKEYKALTIMTIFKAIKSVKNYKQQKFIIYVDALGKKDKRYYGSELHKMGIPSKQVKGITRDQSNALIRLADSFCGFIRDVLTEENGDEKLNSLYKKAIRENILVEV